MVMKIQPKTPEIFFTPQDVVVDIVKTGILRGVTSILEPCAGRGDIIKALRASGYTWDITAVELVSELAEEVSASGIDRLYYGSFFDHYFSEANYGKFDLVIINPPFSLLEDFMEKSHSLLNESGQLIVLMKLCHLVGNSRSKFLMKYRPTSVHLLANRPAFTGGLGDIGGYCWIKIDNPLTQVETTLHWIRRESARERGTDRRIYNGRK